MEKLLNKTGEFDYDFRNDIIFFKVKDREYSRSVELASLVIDFDIENFVVGLQILNASEVLQIPKKVLRGLNAFEMKAKVIDGVIQINLSFKMISRNKTEYRPIIFDRIGDEIPNSEMVCVVK